MSIQFRARIKSAADYKDTISTQGVCCNPDGTKSESSYNDCIQAKGFFQYLEEGETIDNIICPSLSSKGCCCACSYVDSFDDYLSDLENHSGGLQDNVSFCDCVDIGGVWAGKDVSCSTFETSEEVFNLCTDGASVALPTELAIEQDVRFPAGCCVDLGDGTMDCENVCSSNECSDLQPPEGQGTFWPSNACGDTFHDYAADCSVAGFRSLGDDGGLAVPDPHNANILIVNDPKEKDIVDKFIETSRNRDGSVSTCVNNEYECEITSKFNCNGVWTGLRKDGSSYVCNDSEIDTIKTFLKTGTISRDTVESWNLGEYHIAGRFAGLYNGGDGESHLPCEGIGNPETGFGQPYLLENNSTDKDLKTFSKNQYAVIVADADFSRRGLEFDTTNQTKNFASSKFDSIFNMRNKFSLLGAIKTRFIANGIGGKLYPYGWAVPSLHLSAFMNKQIRDFDFITNVTIENNNPSNIWTPLSIQKKYWTSTLVEGANLVYTQMFNNGSVVSASPFKSKCSARPVILIKIK